MPALRALTALALTLAAAPLAAQSFVSPTCPPGSSRSGNACVAPNGIVVQRFTLPQVATDADSGRTVYNLSSDTAPGLNSPAGNSRVVVRRNSVIVTDLHNKLTIISN